MNYWRLNGQSERLAIEQNHRLVQRVIVVINEIR
jgi:hypothetical protein